MWFEPKANRWFPNDDIYNHQEALSAIKLCQTIREFIMLSEM